MQPSLRSAELTTLIQQTIRDQGGAIDFEQYMDLALYAPNLGYYAANPHPFGADGDFVTAPELSGIFASTLAAWCLQQMEALGHHHIIEFGAGSGVLAAALLKALPGVRYTIIEVSACLRARQQALLSFAGSAVAWYSELPQESMQGIVLCNEVLDAMPVQRFSVTKHGIAPLQVVCSDDGAFAYRLGAVGDAGMMGVLGDIANHLPIGYTSECNRRLPSWMRSLHRGFSEVVVCIIDYGYLDSTYYHPDRRMGTLMCYRNHTAHTDPLVDPGLQDITAHVNFTAVGEAAEAEGFKVVSYGTQADFLLEQGVLDVLAQVPASERLAETQALKRLLLPGSMGEVFKVMVLKSNS